MAVLTLSPNSVQCMEALNNEQMKYLPHVIIESNGQCNAPRSDIVSWLTKIGHGDKQTRLLLESLRASLLNDLYHSLREQHEIRHDEQSVRPRESVGYLKFSLLMFAGTIFAICEGYDCITSMLSLFAGIPSLFVLIVGAAFSLLSIVLFYGFDLVEISKNLEIKVSKSSQLLDVLLKQVEQIELIKNRLEERCIHAQTIEEWQELQKIAQMLIVRYHDLDEVRYFYTDALNDPYLNAMKFITAVFAGVIFFGSGFFASQSLAVGVVSFFMLSAVATSFSVLALCSMVGLAACAVYWYVERPGLENLVGRWMGLDREDINLLADDEIVKVHKRKLVVLEGQIDKSFVNQSKLDILTKWAYQSASGRCGRFFQAPSETPSLEEVWNEREGLSI